MIQGWYLLSDAAWMLVSATLQLRPRGPRVEESVV
jgi:hypothetical protein